MSKVIVIEFPHADKDTEWFVSWGGHNPTDDKCAKIFSEDDCWRLHNFINSIAP
jgi:hypothetical protein